MMGGRRLRTRSLCTKVGQGAVAQVRKFRHGGKEPKRKQQQQKDKKDKKE